MKFTIERGLLEKIRNTHRTEEIYIGRKGARLEFVDYAGKNNRVEWRDDIVARYDEIFPIKYGFDYGNDYPLKDWTRSNLEEYAETVSDPYKNYSFGRV